jgi:hypothetical protein
MELAALEKSIFQTIAYFDIYHFPLTAFEVYRNLWQAQAGVNIIDVESALTGLTNKEIIAERDGFFFLKNQADDPVRQRRERYLIANDKMKKSLKYIRLIRLIPFVRAIFIANNLSYLNAPDDADIDLAIIAAPNRIWTARFCAAGLMKLLNKRPTAKTQKNKICLSFFVAEDHLNLQPFAYENDIHFIYWLKQFLPIYGDQDLIDKFFAYNGWTSRFLPNLLPTNTNGRWRLKEHGAFKKFFACLFSGPLGLSLEKFLKQWQLKIMPRRLLELSVSQPKVVVISDAILKFHDKDTRRAVRDAWLKKTV